MNIDASFQIYADANMLEIILRNLISNVLKFTNEKSEIKVSSIQRDNFAEISVRDNGVGMESDVVKKIFLN